MLTRLQPRSVYVFERENFDHARDHQKIADAVTVVIAMDEGPANVGLTATAAHGNAAARNEIIVIHDHEIRAGQSVEELFEQHTFCRQEIVRHVSVEDA